MKLSNSEFICLEAGLCCALLVVPLATYARMHDVFIYTHAAHLDNVSQKGGVWSCRLLDGLATQVFDSFAQVAALRDSIACMPAVRELYTNSPGYEPLENWCEL